MIIHLNQNKIKKTTKIHEKHQLIDRVISEESLAQILKINNPVNKAFFESFYENVVEYKNQSKNQETIEKLPNEEQLFIKYKKMKQINNHFPVKEYQSYIETNNNIRLKYLRLHF